MRLRAAALGATLLLVPTATSEALACGPNDVVLTTLTVSTDTPDRVAPGQFLSLVVTVTRTAAPVHEAEVVVSLTPKRGPRVSTTSRTDSRGVAAVRLAVPRTVRGVGAVTVTAQGLRVPMPCHSEVREQGEAPAESVEIR